MEESATVGAGVKRCWRCPNSPLRLTAATASSPRRARRRAAWRKYRPEGTSASRSSRLCASPADWIASKTDEGLWERVQRVSAGCPSNAGTRGNGAKLVSMVCTDIQSASTSTVPTAVGSSIWRNGCTCPGSYRVIWNGQDERDADVPSGLYFRQAGRRRARRGEDAVAAVRRRGEFGPAPTPFTQTRTGIDKAPLVD